MSSWGVIFDWDGVIIDSEPHHQQSWERLAEELGRPLPEGYFKKSFGMKSERIIPEILQWSNDPVEIRAITDRKAALYREIMKKEGVAPLPGAEPFLHRLKNDSIPCAVASSTPRQNIACVLERIDLQHFFRDIVAAEDVTHGKPHPEIFLLAARRLGLPADRCVVFEDSQVGIEAGLAAGMKVIGVATTHLADSLHRAHRVVQRLDELHVHDLVSMMAADGKPC